MQPDDVLYKICETTRSEVERRKAETPLDTIKNALPGIEPPRGFLKALKSRAAQNRPALIAEIKKASPSKGLIRADFNPAEIARAYENAGAACLSVLTDEPYFQGRDDYLKTAKNTVTLPILRKDFMVDEYQIYESRLLGADCILLIMAALTDDDAKKFNDTAKQLGMDVLVEVHDETELTRAIALNADLIGVNSRNLKTLNVDIQTTYQLLPRIPDTALKVAESGIDSHKTVSDMQEKGFQAFLVGESLMRQPDVETATRELLGL